MTNRRNYKAPEPGERFNKLTVVRCYLKDYKTCNKLSAICTCDCGKTSDVVVTLLRAGKVLSCGCVQKQRASKANKTHGLSKTRLYRVWATMKSRCHNENVLSYPRYGGRGISVCPSWRGSFEEFSDWARLNGYRRGLSIDRIDNDKGYSPENCRWVTHAENNTNRDSTRFLKHDGQSLTVTQWAARTGIGRNALHQRLHRGWDIERALTP